MPPKSRKRKHTDTNSNEDEPVASSMLETEAEETNDEDSASSSSEEELPELMVVNRPRRANAGNKMAELMTKSETDDFYQSTYGGFHEDEADENYESPIEEFEVESEVDSDFDKPEIEDEMSEAEPEDEEKRAKRVDELTQKKRLEEAKRTAELNIASLKKYEEFEIERKKKNLKAPVKRNVPLPLIKTISTAESTTVIVPSVKDFEKPPPRTYPTCAVTGKLAKYRDPVTGLHYADSWAFKVIRMHYLNYLKELDDNEEVRQYLAHFNISPNSKSNVDH